MVKIFQSKPKGFIAIASILIVASVSLIISMTILNDGIDNATLSLSSISYERSRVNATVCLEDTLYRMKNEEHFSSNLNYTIEENEGCNSTINWGTPNTSTPGMVITPVDLTVTGTSNNFVRTFDYDLIVKRVDVNYATGELEHLNIINVNNIQEIID